MLPKGHHLFHAKGRGKTRCVDSVAICNVTTRCHLILHTALILFFLCQQKASLCGAGAADTFCLTQLIGHWNPLKQRAFKCQLKSIDRNTYRLSPTETKDGQHFTANEPTAARKCIHPHLVQGFAKPERKPPLIRVAKPYIWITAGPVRY